MFEQILLHVRISKKTTILLSQVESAVAERWVRSSTLRSISTTSTSTERVACDWCPAGPWMGPLHDSSPRVSHHVVQEDIELSAAAGESGTAEHPC